MYECVRCVILNTIHAANNTMCPFALYSCPPSCITQLFLKAWWSLPCMSWVGGLPHILHKCGSTDTDPETRMSLRSMHSRLSWLTAGNLGKCSVFHLIHTLWNLPCEALHSSHLLTMNHCYLLDCGSPFLHSLYHGWLFWPIRLLYIRLINLIPTSSANLFTSSANLFTCTRGHNVQSNHIYCQ